MATIAASVPCDNSTLANFQAWVAAIWDAFTTLGWTQTSDTGQSANPPTAVPSSAYVYQIFKAADSLAGTTPIYVKVECGYSASAVQIRFTVGTGSDGAGNITGPVIGPIEVIDANNQGSTIYSCYFSGDAGSFRMMMWQTSATVCVVAGIERSRDGSGNPTASYVTFLSAVAGTGGEPFWTQQSFATGTGGPAPGGYPNCSNGGLSTGFYMTTNEVAAFPVIPLVGYAGNQMLAFVGALAGDVNESNGAVATVSVYGANHSYLFSKQGNLVQFGRIAGTNGAIGMLYE